MAPLPDAQPRFFHLINPFTPKVNSEHEIAQRISFASIRDARRFSESVPVEVTCVVYPEDATIVPEGFRCAPILVESILDRISSAMPLKLPLLFDILNAPVGSEEVREDDYIIYTNIDIAPTPGFYQFLKEVASRDFDSFVINRRTLDIALGKGADYGMMYAEMGEKHPGSDCFVFRRRLLGEFVRSECCVGIIAVMKSLLYNLAACSEKMVIFTDAHATFHIGDDRAWKDSRLDAFSKHNRNEATRVALALMERSPEHADRLREFGRERGESSLLALFKNTKPGADGEVVSRGAGKASKSPVGKSPHRPSRAGLTLRQAGWIAMGLSKKVINGSLSRVGFQLVRSSSDVCDREIVSDVLSADGLNPRSISYLVSKRPAVIRVETARGRGTPLGTFGPSGNHPFVVAARRAKGKEGAEMDAVVREILGEYYRLVAPSTVGALIGSSVESALDEFPSWAVTMPWDQIHPREQQGKVERFARIEAGAYDPEVTIENGWTWLGPVDQRKLSVEVKRLSNLLRSVMQKGYRRDDQSDGDIRAVILVDESDDWRWLSTGGQHRAAVVSALGHETVPVRVTSVIRRSDASCWPNVTNGLYTVDQAREWFDQIFSGNYLGLFAEWEKRHLEN